MQDKVKSSFSDVSLVNRFEDINEILRNNIVSGDRFSVMSHVFFFTRNSPGTARRILSANLDSVKYSDVFGIYRDVHNNAELPCFTLGLVQYSRRKMPSK